MSSETPLGILPFLFALLTALGLPAENHAQGNTNTINLASIDQALANLAKQRYEYSRRKTVFFPSGKTNEVEETVTIDFHSVYRFKISSVSTSCGRFNDREIFKGDEDLYYTDQFELNAVRISKFTPEFLYRALRFHPSFFLFGFRKADPSVIQLPDKSLIRSGKTIAEIRTDNLGRVNFMSLSDEGEKQYELSIKAFAEDGLPSHFHYIQFRSGSRFKNEIWSLRNIEELKGERLNPVFYNYEYKPGYRVTDEKGNTFFTEESIRSNK